MNSTLDMFAEFDPTGPPPELLTGSDVVTEGTRGSWATFSADRVYRYLLARVWDDHAPMLVVGMLNPSKAGAHYNDPTVTRVVGFARRDRYGGTLIWNVAALVATDPRELCRHDDPVGPRNYEAINAAINAPMPACSVFAWGRPQNERVRLLITIAKNAAFGRRRPYAVFGRRRPWRFGEPTKEGHPRHPLRLRAGTPIVRHDL